MNNKSERTDSGADTEKRVVTVVAIVAAVLVILAALAVIGLWFLSPALTQSFSNVMMEGLIRLPL